MAVLDWQKQSRMLQRMQEDELIKREQEMLKQQWSVEEDQEKKAEYQKFLLNRERNLELIQHNATEKQLREQAEEMEKMRDKQLLEAALTYEQQVE